MLESRNMSKNSALNNEGLPTLTTKQAADFLEMCPDRLRDKARKQGGWCQQGKWLVMQDTKKRNCWYPYKAQKPRDQ